MSYVVALLTLLCRIETTAVPWSPYFVIYGLLALLIPLWLGVAPIRPTRLAGKALWRLTAVVAVLALLKMAGLKAPLKLFQVTVASSQGAVIRCAFQVPGAALTWVRARLAAIATPAIQYLRLAGRRVRTNPS